MQIRFAMPDDYTQWRPLWDGYNRFYGRFDAPALPEEMPALTWARFHDTAAPMHALVAEKDGRLIGLVHYLFHRSTILKNDTCYLQDLFTDSAARGGGVGRALIEAVYEQARKCGSQRVYWVTQETNAVAMVLYNQIAERTGFLVYRKQPL